MRKLVWILASVVLMGYVATAAWSSEADELREKAKALQQQAEQAAKIGRREEAEKFSREAQELHQAAQKHERKQPDVSHREIDELHGRLKALAQKEQALKESQSEEGLAELRKHRAMIERELAELREHQEHQAGPRHAGKHPPKSPQAAEETGLRIKHIRVAVENLNAAGLHDIAEHLAHKADAMEREHHQAHGEFRKDQSSPEKRKHFEPERKFAPAAGPVDELRHEIQRLRAELNELREEIRKRP